MFQEEILTMACVLGIEQDCNDCRMSGNGKGGKKMNIGDLKELIKGLKDDTFIGFNYTWVFMLHICCKSLSGASSEGS